MPEPDWDLWTLDAMRLYGGSFVQALRKAYLVADEENQRRIREGWPEYGLQYRSMAGKLAAANPEKS